MDDGIKVTAEIEATDQLGMLLRRVQVETPHQGELRTQAAAIVEKIDYLGCELKLIEVDGVSKAVQIRSKKPMPDGSEDQAGAKASKADIGTRRRKRAKAAAKG